MDVIDTRRDQMYPVLDVAQMGIAKRFASSPARTFAPGEVLFDVGALELDKNGFVVTGVPVPGAREQDRRVLPLETSHRGVFAIGDVRSGSTKRVAAAVGEGAAVVAQLHALLADG
jgi:thioredoxin reductase